jgi:hypothetical protein
VDDYQSPRRPELQAIRVRICESEIQAFLQKFPQLSRDEIFEEMSKTGPDRAKVMAAIGARAKRPAAKLAERIKTEAHMQAIYQKDREAERAPHPSESVIRKL